MLDIKEIQKYLPHRYPFLLVDRILEIEEGKRVVGIKNVTMNEDYFIGHFPGHPIMPGVLIIEAMAQTAALLALYSVHEGERSSIIYFTGIDKAKFRRPVVPGDQIRFELDVLKQRRNLWRFSGNAFVEKNLVAEAEIQAMIGV
ncbi:MAG: 3-hydroxyacyl-ACP dehydratase FabZ [Nitrospinae bacterium]|nr:3-hydroxyacyl-ACP dehydratase FabZ [Nitrospinota bacterium]